MSQYILAHDLGTSGNKATLYSTDGKLVKSTVYSYDLITGENNLAEQRADDPIHLLVFFGTEGLGHQDPKALGQSLDHAQHQPVEPVRSAQSRQSADAQSFAYDGGIHNSVQLLEDIAQHQRHGKGEDQP